MSSNAYTRFLALLPPKPLMVGTVSAVQGALVSVTLEGGGLVTARGQATIGDRVFVRDNVIEGTAPSLTYIAVEV